MTAKVETDIFYGGKYISPERSGPFLRYTFKLVAAKYQEILVPSPMDIVNIARVTSNGVLGVSLKTAGVTPGEVIKAMSHYSLDEPLTEGETIVLLAITAL